MTTNPFYFGSELVDQNDIIGRDEEAQEISSWLKSGNNVRLLGPRRIGKSTFLNKLAYELKHDKSESWNLIKIDLSSAFSSLAVLRSIIDAANSSNISANVQKQLNKEFLILEKTSGLNVSLQGIAFSTSTKEIISPAETEELIKRCLKIFVANIPNLVIAFDEFQNLIFLPGEETFQVLSIIRGALMSNSTETSSVLVTGSIKRSMDLLLSEPSSPLLHQLQHYSLKRIHRVDWINYLYYMFESTNKPINKECLEFVVQQTQSHALRTKQFAAMIWQNTHHNQSVDILKVQESWDKLLDDYTYEFQNRISEMSANKDVNALRVLYALTENGWKGITSKNVLQKYGFTSKDDITRSKDKLIVLGLIEKINEEYILSDPLFKSYLQHHPMVG